MKVVTRESNQQPGIELSTIHFTRVDVIEQLLPSLYSLVVFLLFLNSVFSYHTNKNQGRNKALKASAIRVAAVRH